MVILGWTMLAVFSCTAALPTLACALVSRQRIERELGAAVGAPVQVERFDLGWTTGLAVDGLVIAQPAGTADPQPLLKLSRARLRFGWLAALGARLDVGGELQGLELRLVQRADGSLRLPRGGQVDVDIEPRPDQRPPRGVGGSDLQNLLQRIRADLALRDVTIDLVHETQGTLEQIRRLQATIDKRPGSTDFELSLSAEFPAPNRDQAPGKLALTGSVDGTMRRPIELQLTAAGLDFGRYRPLLDATLGPGRLSKLAGVLDGTVQVRIEDRHTVRVQGGLTLDRPQLAGSLVQGMDIALGRCVVNPNLTLQLDPAGGLPTAELGTFDVDLEFARVRGVAAEAARAAFSGQSALGLDFSVDLQRLAQFGGPMPKLLAGQPIRVAGRALLQVGPQLLDQVAGATTSLDALMRFVASHVAVTADVSAPAGSFGGAALAGVELAAALRQGKLEAKLGPGATLNGGPLRLDASVDLAGAGWPTALTFAVDGGALTSDVVPALQYVVPLFAGLSEQVGAQLQGRGTLSLALSGPARNPAASLLGWLDHWSGNGKLALEQGSVRPAEQFAGLLQWLEPNTQGLLEFDALTTDFTLRQGGVETALLKLDRKAKKLALHGRTGLDGRLDHRLDLAELMRGHRDGEKILAWLQGKPLEAALQGSLTAPQLALPDLQKLLADAAKGAAERELRKGAENLLQKGLEELFKKRK